jgi:hypothetical protein
MELGNLWTSNKMHLKVASYIEKQDLSNTQVSPCGICGGQSGTGTGSALTSLAPYSYHLEDEHKAHSLTPSTLMAMVILSRHKEIYFYFYIPSCTR